MRSGLPVVLLAYEGKPRGCVVMAFLSRLPTGDNGEGELLRNESLVWA